MPGRRQMSRSCVAGQELSLCFETKELVPPSGFNPHQTEPDPLLQFRAGAALYFCLSVCCGSYSEVLVVTQEGVSLCLSLSIIGSQ